MGSEETRYLKFSKPDMTPCLKCANSDEECDDLPSMDQWQPFDNIADMSLYDDRLRSFDEWPRRTIGSSPSDFASHGFFYTGFGDFVKCFSCGVQFGNHLNGDSITERHDKYLRETCVPCHFRMIEKRKDEEYAFLYATRLY